MKEIGMEKLIELLNEYTKKEKFGIIWKLGEDPIGVYGYVNDKYGLGWASKLVIISKDYGFIKWLVENDKIDFENQAMQYAKSDLSKFFTEWGDKNGMSDDYAMLLMLLSIQDEPIRFLCEIIK